MTILYRRFLLLTALLTVFASIFANVILQTRVERTRMHIVQTTPFSGFAITSLPTTYGSSTLPIELFEKPCFNKRSCL